MGAAERALHVMAGHSRSKNGVASLAYVPAIHVFAAGKKDVDARDKPGHDAGSIAAAQHRGTLTAASNPQAVPVVTQVPRPMPGAWWGPGPPHIRRARCRRMRA